MRESRKSGAMRAKAEWLSYSTTIAMVNYYRAGRVCLPLGLSSPEPQPLKSPPKPWGGPPPPLKLTGRSFRGGKSLSRHSRSATGLPSLANSTTLRVIASASPFSKAWVARVALFKAPRAADWGCRIAQVRICSCLFFSCFFRRVKTRFAPPGAKRSSLNWGSISQI